MVRWRHPIAYRHNQASTCPRHRGHDHFVHRRHSPSRLHPGRMCCDWHRGLHHGRLECWHAALCEHAGVQLLEHDWRRGHHADGLYDRRRAFERHRAPGCERLRAAPFQHARIHQKRAPGHGPHSRRAVHRVERALRAGRLSLQERGPSRLLRGHELV